jgi:hypothetical protein
LEHLRKAHLGFECRFRFLVCKKSGILLISEPLPNAEGKAGHLPLGVECDWSIVPKLLGRGIYSTALGHSGSLLALLINIPASDSDLGPVLTG